MRSRAGNRTRGQRARPAARRAKTMIAECGGATVANGLARGPGITGQENRTPMLHIAAIVQSATLQGALRDRQPFPLEPGRHDPVATPRRHPFKRFPVHTLDSSPAAASAINTMVTGYLIYPTRHVDSHVPAEPTPRQSHPRTTCSVGPAASAPLPKAVIPVSGLLLAFQLAPPLGPSSCSVPERGPYISKIQEGGVEDGLYA